VILEVVKAGNPVLSSRSEPVGQEELVKAGGTRLPAEGTINPAGYRDAFDWSLFGLKIGEVVEDDTLWVHAELPQGWQIKASNHSMWSYLYDEEGRKRAGIFYKAAFYDRSCHIQPEQRYAVSIEAAGEDEYDIEGPQFAVIKDADEEIFRLGPFESKPKPKDKYSSENWRAYNIAEEAGEAYMKEHYPDWRKSEAYWD